MTKLLGESEFSRWDDYVLRHKFGSIYHTSGWLNLIKKTYGLEPVVMVKANGSTVAGIPFLFRRRLLFSSKMSCVTSAHFCNPLVEGDGDFGELIDFALEFAERESVQRIELRMDADFGFHNHHLVSPNTDHCTYRLPLNGTYDEIRAAYHKNCILRPLKNAEKSGVKVIAGSSMEDVKIFYGFYEAMRRQNGLLPQPMNFFQNLWQAFGKTGNCAIYHAQYEGRIVSSIINLMYKDTYTYEYGATLDGCRNIHPSHCLIDYSIRDAISKGYGTFDFGRTQASNIGLSQFKERWGGQKIGLNYYTLPAREAKQSPARGLAKKIASHLIPVMPKPVCRLAGRLIYRVEI